MVPNGAVLTYVGTWQAGGFGGGFWQTTNQLISAVTQDLLAQGIAVRTSSTDQSIGNIISGMGGGQFNITMQVQVENGLGFNSSDDIVSIIRGAVYQETGQFPLSDSMPYDCSTGSCLATGQPVPTPTGQSSGCIAGTSNDLTGNFSISCWFSNLTTKGFSSIGMIAILVVVGLILLAKTERVVS